LQQLQDSVASLRNPPGLPGTTDNVFEVKQAFLTGSGAVSANDLVGEMADIRPDAARSRHE
jgi:hypothetical protein